MLGRATASIAAAFLMVLAWIWASADTELRVGYAVVSPHPGNPPPVAMALFRSQDGQGDTLWEASIEAVAPVESGWIAVDEAQGRRTSLALANGGSATVSAEMKLLSQQGSVEGVRVVDLGPGEKTARFLDEWFDIPPNFRGALRFTADGPLAGVTLQQASAPGASDSFSALPLFRWTPDETGNVRLRRVSARSPIGASRDLRSPGRVVLPQVASGGGLQTTVVLLNPHFRECSGTLLRYVSTPGEEGSAAPVSAIPYRIPQAGSFRVEFNGEGAVESGFAEAVPDDGSPLPQAVALFRYKSRGWVSEAGVPAMEPQAAFRTWVDDTGGDTAIALANPSDSASSATLILLDRQGIETARRTLALQAHSHNASFVRELFPEAPLRGSLVVEADAPAAATVLRLFVRPDGLPVVTSFPVVSEPPDPPEEQFFPQVAFGSGFSTSFSLMNVDQIGAAAGILRLLEPSGDELVTRVDDQTDSQFGYALAPGATLRPDLDSPDYGCGDLRNSVIDEYPRFGADLLPGCADFTRDTASAHFVFVEMNSGDFRWAIVPFPFLSSLEETRGRYGFRMIVNSGYRNPGKQDRINPRAPHSRHLHGDAADIRVEDNDADSVLADDWERLRQAAKTSGACVEPFAFSGPSYVHMDWRGPCPAGW